MTLPTSGPISFSQIAKEAGLGRPISLGNTKCRSLAHKASGRISVSDLKGKSAQAPIRIRKVSSDAMGIHCEVIGLNITLSGIPISIKNILITTDPKKNYWLVAYDHNHIFKKYSRLKIEFYVTFDGDIYGERIGSCQANEDTTRYLTGNLHSTVGLHELTAYNQQSHSSYKNDDRIVTHLNKGDWVNLLLTDES